MGQAPRGRLLAGAGRGAMLFGLGLFLIASVAQAQDTSGNAGVPADTPVSSIAIRGNDNVPAEEIFAAIKHTKVGESFDAAKTQEDLKSIYALGYFSDLSADLGGNGGGVRVTFKVVENPVIKDITVSGIPGVSAGSLKPLLTVKEGEVLDWRKLNSDREVLTGKVWQALGVLARLEDASIDAKGVLKLTLAGIRLGQIRVEGNKKTREYVIRREFSLKPGDVVDAKELSRSLRRVLMLGFFDEVSADFGEVKASDPDKIDVVVNVKERSTGAASFGAGYSSQDGLVGQIDVSDRNFSGNGQQAGLRWEFGKKKNTYDISFFEPFADDNRTSVGFNLYNRQFKRDNDDGSQTEQKVGGDISVGRPYGEFSRGYLRLRAERWSIQPEAGGSDEGTIHSLGLSYVTDTSDHPFYPTTGYRSRLSFEVGGYFLGGDNDFTKSEAALTKYLKAGDGGQTWALRVQAGSATGDVPKTEKYRVGGGDTIRGYNYGEFPGTSMLVLSGEYRFPVSKGVQGVVFTDAGTAWDGSTGETLVGLDSLKMGYGLGIRVDTPIGVLRIDYGVGEAGGRSYFSLGQSY
ncbi:MAG: BamA/TamA family outer membrane protein [Firmicutes bacterium]|nr:BamA/TamA family outer membrane protein [Bacillota bacterium]